MGEENWRLGHKVRTFGGVRQDCDPGALPPWMFRNAVNVRFSGGGIGERGGQSKLNPDDQLEGCGTGIIPGDAVPATFDETLYTLTVDMSPGADPGTAEILPWTPAGGLGVSVAGPDHLVNLQETEGNDPEGALESITSSNRTSPAISGDLQWNADFVGNDPPDFQTVGASEGCCGGLAKFEEFWYQGLVTVSGGVPLYRVYRLDPGPIATLDREYAATPGSDSSTRVWLAHYEERNELLAAIEPMALDRKSAAGVWTRVPLPAGCFTNRNHLANWAEFEGLFYFTGYGPGGGHLLYEYDGANIAAVHTWAGSPGTYSPLVVHEGALYYGINAGGVIQLGRFDSETFEVVSTLSGASEIRQLLPAFGRLFAFRGSTLESTLAPESAPFAVDNSTANSFHAGGRRRLR